MVFVADTFVQNNKNIIYFILIFVFYWETMFFFLTKVTSNIFQDINLINLCLPQLHTLVILFWKSYNSWRVSDFSSYFASSGPSLIMLFYFVTHALQCSKVLPYDLPYFGHHCEMSSSFCMNFSIILSERPAKRGHIVRVDLYVCSICSIYMVPP